MSVRVEGPSRWTSASLITTSSTMQERPASSTPAIRLRIMAPCLAGRMVRGHLSEDLPGGSERVGGGWKAGVERDVRDHVGDLLATGPDRQRSPDVAVNLRLPQGDQRRDRAETSRLHIKVSAGPGLRPLHLGGDGEEEVELVAGGLRVGPELHAAVELACVGELVGV